MDRVTACLQNVHASRAGSFIARLQQRGDIKLVLDIFSSLMLTPVFWLVMGVLLLGLELINRRLVWFLPGSLVAFAISFLMVIHPLVPAYMPRPPATAGAALLLWLVVTCGGICVFAVLRPRIRRHHRRRNRRQLFS